MWFVAERTLHYYWQINTKVYYIYSKREGGTLKVKQTSPADHYVVIDRKGTAGGWRRGMYLRASSYGKEKSEVTDYEQEHKHKVQEAIRSMYT